jgi:DNA-directed RNA polymerase subunit E'/Rpb7
MFRHIRLHHLDSDVRILRQIFTLRYRLRPEDISDGRVQDTSGDVIYKVKFKALVFRPFRGEVLDGVIHEVSSNGIVIESGPLHSFISHLVRKSYIPDMAFRE